jgi:hypothetical protein
MNTRIYLIAFVLSMSTCQVFAQEDVAWTNLGGASVSGTTLTKTASTAWGNAGAESANKLIASTNGYVQYTVATTTAGDFFFGLSETNPNNQFQSIEYAFYRTNGTLTYVRLAGVTAYTFHCAVSDVLVIERSGTSMLFKRNGTTVHTVTSVTTNQMLVDVALNQNGAQIADLKVSFPPLPPTSPGATDVSPTAIDVTWTDASTNETGFEVQRSTTSGSGYSLVTTTAANATSFSDTGLTSSTTYYYRIRAKNGGANSAYTSEVSETTPSAAPTSPTAPSTSSVTATSITVNWTDNSSNETGFEVERSTTSGSGFSLVTTTSANATSFSDTGLTSEIQYYYRVRAVNGAVASSYTSQVNATTLPATPPSVPTDLSATAASPTSIVIEWTDVSTNETGFEVERSTTPSSGYSLITTTTPNATSHLDNSLTPNTLYYYRARSKNAAGTSSYTSITSATTPLAPPAAPESLSAVPGVSSINLSWTDNSSNESEFIIERSGSSGTGFAVVGSAVANAMSYQDAAITPGQPYYYRVKAINAGGNSTYTDEVTATLNIPGVTKLCKGLFCDAYGSVGIGTQIIPSGYKLSVKGKMMAEGVKVDLQSAWPDYVFENSYRLKDLPSLRSYINSNGHLPNMPTAAEVEKEGIDLEEINVKLVEKVEELSLYLIQMEERIKKLEKENTLLKTTKGGK